MNSSASADPSRFFTLTPLRQSEESAAYHTRQTKRFVIGLGPVRFPAYLDRNQIVTRISDNRIVVSENERWAEPLEESINRVMSQNLALLLPGVRVIRSPWQTTQRPRYQIDVEIVKFEATVSQQAELLARWGITDSSQKRSVVIKDSRLRLEVKTKSTEASVAALSQALGDLCQDIAGNPGQRRSGGLMLQATVERNQSRRKCLNAPLACISHQEKNRSG